MTCIAILGAGGKMGYRITKNLIDSEFEVRAVDVSEVGQKRIAELGLKPVPQNEAMEAADVVILALPDTLIGKVARDVFPKMKTGTMVFIMDAAAPIGGELPEGFSNLTYFLAHPCHPAIYYADDSTPEQRHDFMGGIAPQAIVCALMQGPEEHYAMGARIAAEMWKPITRVHRVTADQLGILEPGLSECVALSCVDILRQALDECERLGVPREAAFDFLMGHINVELAMNFGFRPNNPSDGAKLILDWSQPKIIKEGWKDLLQIETVREACRVIARGRR